MIRYGSLCSGVEAASVAWQPLGWKPEFFAEIDPQCNAVLAHRFPEVPNLGDIRKIDTGGISVDVLVGGTPCQSFSVAGLRAGMDDPRGGLALEFLKVARRLHPRWIVWENVPGVLSSNGGRDFGSFLGGLAELGYGFAYRVLDARFFGVPQRRRRVFVVAHSGGAWQRAAAVLFDSASLSGRAPSFAEAGESVASVLAAGSGGRGSRLDAESAAGGHIVPEFLIGGDTAHTLRDSGFDASEDGTGRGTPVVAEAYSTSGAGWWWDGVGTPSAHDQKDFSNCGIVAWDPQGGGKQGRLGYREDSPDSPTLGTKKTPAVAYPSGPVRRLRRLTPKETERLQGLPDDYTLVPYRGRPMADGPRYRMVGNSFAVPCVRWIGERIQMVEEIAS